MSSLSDAQVSFQQPLTFVDCSPGVFAALFAADLNSDGRADLLCSDGTLNLGNGDGTFKLGSPISTENSQGIAAVADFNGDGKPDVLETSPNGALLVLLGSGDGTFQKPVSSPGVIFQPLAAVDLSGDGKSDVVGVPPGNGSLNVCISNGNGTFRACVPYSLGTAGYDSAVAVADFNGDGKPDVAVYTAAQVLVFFGNGDGTLEAPKTSTAPTYDSFTYNTFYLVAGDFNGDGKVDLAIGAGCGTQVCPVTAYTLLGNGDGTFQTPRANTFNTVPFVQVDLDGDGKADLVSAGTPTIAQVYLGQADGTFSLEHTYVTTFSASIFTTTTIATADFNSDGKADIASAGGVLLGKGDGTFQGLPFSSGFTGYPVVGDFEKIGRPDLALATTGATTTIYVTHNNGDGTFSLIHTYSAPEGTIVAGDASFMEGDVNGDGNLDFVVIGEDPASNQYEYSVFIGNGDGTFQQPVSYMPGMLGIGSGSAVIADLDNDDKLDLVKLGGDQISGSTILTVLLGNGDGTFSTPVTYYPGGSNPGGSASLLLGDFNGDGKTDIAISNIGLGTNVLYGNGDGTFQPSVIPAQTEQLFCIHGSGLEE